MQKTVFTVHRYFWHEKGLEPFGQQNFAVETVQIAYIINIASIYWVAKNSLRSVFMISLRIADDDHINEPIYVETTRQLKLKGAFFDSYKIRLKQNQPALYKNTEDYFSEFSSIISSKITLEKGHGRIEKRKYLLLTDL